MGKLFRTVVVILVILLFSTSSCFAETPITAEQTVISNTLPDVTIYAYTDVKYDINADNIQVYINDYETDLQSADIFESAEEGTTYFLLVDVSGSIKQADFETIKKYIKKFSEVIEPHDNIYLIPFGESVYVDKTKYGAGSEELVVAIESLSAKDDYTQLYAAIDSVVGLTVSEENLCERKVALVFSDGLDDTTGGLITRDEAVSKINDAGIPLYAFAVGKNVSGKNELGILARSVNGCLWQLNEESLDGILEQFQNILDGTLVIKAKVKNSEDIADTFTIRVMKGGRELLVKNNITAHKSDASKDVFSVAVGKLLSQYWWIIAVVCVALIAIITLLVIRRNKGIVNVDGKIVYGSKVQKKYHVKVKEYNKKEVRFSIIENSNDLSGQSDELTVEITESIIVGRNRECEVQFDDPSMSRQHFSIELISGELYVQDLESTGGTYLNGVKVYAKERIASGDLIAAGRIKMRIYWD